MAKICAVSHILSKTTNVRTRTQVIQKTVTGTGGAYIDYSISNQPDRAVITGKVVITAQTDSDKGRLENNVVANTSYWQVNGVRTSLPATTVTGTNTLASQEIGSASVTVYKTKSAQNVSVSASYTLWIRLTELYNYSATDNQWTDVPTTTIQISAKTSYTVSFNLNGGTGSIPNQTKWYNETLTLTTAKPTKSGYTFKGWATTLANAQAGNANQGATYTGNANATFYAVWELNYSKPIINSVSIERCLQDGSEDDEGDYASVHFEWKVFKSSLARYYGGNTYPYANNSVSNCTITVGTQTLTPTLSVAEGSGTFVVGSGTFELDTTYDATISITDSQTIVSNHTTTTGGTLPTAFFPMDFNADASAVGFFMSAPDTGDGVYSGKDIHFFVDENATSGWDALITEPLTVNGWTDALE